MADLKDLKKKQYVMLLWGPLLCSQKNKRKKFCIYCAEKNVQIEKTKEDGVKKQAGAS